MCAAACFTLIRFEQIGVGYRLTVLLPGQSLDASLLFGAVAVAKHRHHCVCCCCRAAFRELPEPQALHQMPA